MASGTAYQAGPYSTNGSDTVFQGGSGFVIAAQEGSDDYKIRVELVDQTTLVGTTLVEGTGAGEYSVTRNATTGEFYITTVTTYPSGSEIWIVRNEDYNQERQFRNQGTTFATTNLGAHDEAMRTIQENKEVLSRALVLALGDTTDPTDLVDAIKVLVPGSTVTVVDNKFTITGSDDATKLFQFELDTNIATGETRIWKVGDRDLDLGKFYANATGFGMGATPVETDGLTVAGNITTKGNLSVGEAAVDPTSTITMNNQSGFGILTLDGAAEFDSSVWINIDGQRVARSAQYKTIPFPAGALAPRTTNGAEAGTLESTTNKITLDYKAFGKAAEEFVQIGFRMPDEWDGGQIKAIFNWSSATGSTTGDTVEWTMKAATILDGGTIDTALGTQQVISDALLADSGAEMQETSATPFITVGGTPLTESWVQFEISRNVTGTDDMAEDAWLFGVTIQYRESETEAGLW